MNIIEMMPYVLAVEAVIACVALVWVIWHFKLRIVYKAEFFRQTGSTAFGSKKLVKVGQKDFKPTDQNVTYKGASYPIMFDKKAHDDGRVHVWAFDVEKKIGLTFGGYHDIGDPDFVDDLLESGVLKQLSRLISSVNLTTWIIIALFAVVAVLAFVSGLFASPYVLGVPSA